ncbi:hypothetical protein [Photorhabdus sp. CRCIA-P01]|nr:hypothetical protein [Photorhabdus sp. CRCIA-P01]
MDNDVTGVSESSQQSSSLKDEGYIYLIVLINLIEVCGLSHGKYPVC